jgi:DNA helicase II / ATP-dependent DNA helicase PcrA
MSQSTDFLKNLNPAQRKAVEKVYGQILVLAGPGTGKTHLLTARIAHLLQQDVGAHAHNILCLTFTEAGATEMRDRLQSSIGNEAYKVKISTFHGFCQWVMDEYPEYFETKRGTREVADDLQKALAFQASVQSKKWEFFSSVWDDFIFRHDILSAISKLKRENISAEGLRTLIPDEKKRLEEDPENFYKRKFSEFKEGDFKPKKREEIDRKIRRMEELADFWDVYEAKMKEKGFFDFDDQLMWVIGEVKENENLRLDLAERFQWVLVDEYQDTNSVQNELLWALSDFHDDPNIFAVGDDDQAIYRFQGASVENIFEFQKHFPSHEQITLTENYRSAQNILDGAFASIANNKTRADADKKLTASGANKDFAGTIHKAVFGARLSELGFLVERIQQSLKEGTAPGEIAILCRKNAEVLEIARELPKFGIPVSAQIFQNIFEDQWIRILILMLEIFADPGNDEKMMELLHTQFFGISGEKLLQLSLKRNEEKTSVIALLERESESDESLENIFNLIINSRQQFWHCRPEVLIEKLLYESGLAEFISQKDNETSSEDWQMIRKFIEWAREQKCEKLSDLLERIDLHAQLGIPVRPNSLPADQRAVHILTAHGSKGREFDIVFLPGLLDRVWGNNRARNGIALPQLFHEEHDENEDERRLFFVAMTRARKEIFLSYSATDFSGREKNPSQFWHEIPDSVCTLLPRDKTEESVQKLLPVFLSTKEQPLFTAQEKEILQARVKDFVWSATSLQTYLDCPRKFLYQRLLRFPRRPLPQLALGVSLHEALERFLEMYKRTKELPTQSLLLSEFERALRGQNLEKKEFEKWLDHGKEVLENYFEKRKEAFKEDSLIEFAFSKYNPAIDDIRITGKMDRVDFLDEGKTKVKIVDYKSGKPRAITKGESLWRQLVFYDLLAQNSKDLGWSVDVCELEFLTSSDHTGKIGQRQLEVSEEDRQQVISELQDAHKKVQNLEFPFVPNQGNDPEIEYWQNFGQ